LTATIRDVARVAGCSIKTVSRVVNDEPFVTEATRAKVKAAIRTVGYAPNMSARRLVQNRSFMICILIYPGFYLSASDILTRIVDIGYEDNYDILIQPYFPPHSRSKKKLVSLIYEKRIDGFVLTPPLDADEFVADLLDTYKVPLVQVSPLVNNPEIPYVTGEDRQGALAMTEYLISLGHRRISFLTGPRNMGASHERLAGYRQAFAAHDLPLDEIRRGRSTAATPWPANCWRCPTGRPPSSPGATRRPAASCMQRRRWGSKSRKSFRFAAMTTWGFQKTSGPA
jgi:LacI family transcriptional regulator